MQKVICFIMNFLFYIQNKYLSLAEFFNDVAFNFKIISELLLMQWFLSVVVVKKAQLKENLFFLLFRK